ncbi:RHS repeat-associated core domain-containing protein [Cronobacter dublinensis]|uniref:RHS repeat-associated core domain-containing protein n=1 Tax=Cronobacter dublinensis TaxID=413497 RepID=UPI003AB97E6D
MQLRHGGATHTLAAYGRDRLHREISRSQGVLSQETHYDTAGRITQRTVLDARRELVFERRYRWDRTDQIVQQIHTDATPATPGEKYSQYLWGYDASGQVTKAVEPQKEERFFWDPAGNRTEEHRNPVWHNLLLRLDGLKLDYDGFGRLVQRRDRSGVIQHFTYDDEQRVKEITFTGHAEFRKVEYRYDPLGRRTHKILWRYNDPQPETIRFDWQGLQLAGEQSDREPDHYVQYVYTEGSYEPLARIDSVFDDCEIYWYHTELNGLPERVTDADGHTVWRGQFSTWGKTERELSVPQWQVPQNLRFQGQYLDRESGLHYNLFRYYDPVAGRYTQMDPIGLLGGINTYGYVPDPLTWVDPLGLCFSKRLGDFGEAKVKSELEASGKYIDVFSIQNKSNNGIDLVGLRHDGKYDFFEVKTNTTGRVGELSKRQSRAPAFINTVLRKDVPNGSYDLNGHDVRDILKNMGDARVVDVFVERAANGRWFVSKYLISVW